MSIFIKNIGRLVTMEAAPGRYGALGVLEDASLIIKAGRIDWFGNRKDIPSLSGEVKELDAKGGVVAPALIDCHTHIVHAGSRQNEFSLRSQGKTYWEIAEAGGGIMSTVRATREASEGELLKLGRQRIKEALFHGTSTVEIKSGYGLDLKTELKILRVINKLKKTKRIKIFSTFLGAHVVPQEFKNNRAAYINLVVDKMLPKVAQLKFADFCDVFVEDGAFTIEEGRVIAAAAKKYGMAIRLHVDQFKDIGGAKLAAELGALSADHLEYISDEGITALKNANVTAVLLPGATFFVGGKHYAPARRLIDAGVRVAIATDYNPGTNPCLDLFLTGTIAAAQMGMTLDEVWRGITINAAYSLGIEKECGSIAVGKRADIISLDAPDEYYPFYRYGKNCVLSLFSGSDTTP